MPIDPTVFDLFLAAFLGAVAGCSARGILAAIAGRRAAANAQRPWPTDWSAAATLERVRRVLDALAEEAADLRTSEFDRANAGPDAALLERLLNRAGVTETDLGELSEDLQDLESRVDPEAARRAFPGEDW